MKLYRDMTPAEKRRADQHFKFQLAFNKLVAEEKMNRWDNLSVEERAAIRASEETTDVCIV